MFSWFSGDKPKWRLTFVFSRETSTTHARIAMKFQSDIHVPIRRSHNFAHKSLKSVHQAP